MDTYEVEFEAAEPDGFAVTVPAFPGLLILGATLTRRSRELERRSRSMCVRLRTAS